MPDCIPATGPTQASDRPEIAPAAAGDSCTRTQNLAGYSPAGLTLPLRHQSFQRLSAIERIIVELVARFFNAIESLKSEPFLAPSMAMEAARLRTPDIGSQGVILRIEQDIQETCQPCPSI